HQLRLRTAVLALSQFKNTTRPCDQGDRRAPKFLRRFFNVLSLKPLRTLSNREFHTIAFLERFVSVADDSGIVDKHISASGPLNEFEPLFVVEPLYLSLLFAHHRQTPFT